MCGIAGLLSADPEHRRLVVERMLEAMRHRGPEGHGLIERATPGGRLVLGHRRLALVDLTPTGAQPMVHAVSGNVLVFNGESMDSKT